MNWEVSVAITLDQQTKTDSQKRLLGIFDFPPIYMKCFRPVARGGARGAFAPPHRQLRSTFLIIWEIPKTSFKKKFSFLKKNVIQKIFSFLKKNVIQKNFLNKNVIQKKRTPPGKKSWLRACVYCLKIYLY